MIRLCDSLQDIARIWSEAFGDEFHDIKFFYDNVKNGVCYAYYCDEIAVSMLYLVNCRINGKESHYIYAACTLKAYKEKGYMSELLEYVLKKFDSVCLIPANDSLIKFYTDRSFKYKYDISNISFDESDVLVDDYLFEGCSLDEAFILCSK